MQDRNQQAWNNKVSPYFTRARVTGQSSICRTCLSNSSSSSSVCSSRTRHIIRSIVDELYETINQDSSCEEMTKIDIEPRELSKEKRVRFALETNNQEPSSVELNRPRLESFSRQNSNISSQTDTMFDKVLGEIKRQPVLSESTTIVCCSIEARPKIDCSVSTSDNDLADKHLRSDCGTQTMFSTFSKQSDSLTSLLETIDDRSSVDLHRTQSTMSLSSIQLFSSKSMIDHSFASSISSNPTFIHSFYSNLTTIESSNIAHQLVMPSKAEHYSVCQEIPMDTFHDTISYTPETTTTTTLQTLSDIDASIRQRNNRFFKLCTCTQPSSKMIGTVKRKKSDHYQQFASITQLIPTPLRKSLGQLRLPKRCLSSMHKDGLFYIHELVFIYLENRIEFDRILTQRYYLSKKIAHLFRQTMEKWWMNHRSDFFCLLFS